MFGAALKGQPTTAAVALLVLALIGCQKGDITGTLRPTAGEALADVTAGNAAGAKLCQKDGWQSLSRPDASQFSSEGDCVAHVAMGGKLGQRITFTSSNPSPVQIDDPSYAPTATASSGLAVTIRLDAASTGCVLVNGTVSFNAAGTCLVDANQAGDGIWAPAPQVQQSITVNRKSQTITFTSINPSPVHVGAPGYIPQATASSGLVVTFALAPTSTGCALISGTVSFTAAGTCLIDANQAGNGTWAPAPVVRQSIRVTVNPAVYCASIGGTYAGLSSTYLWTCYGWPASSLEDAEAKATPLFAACRADNGATTGGVDYGYTEPFPTDVDLRCHLPS